MLDEASTAEFHSLRKRGIGSSDISAIMGVSPWMTIQELYLDKTSEVTEYKDNWAMARGRELEPVARDIYEFEFDVLMPAKRLVHPRFDYFLANTDGFNAERNYGIEIKCPGKKDLELTFLKGEVPEKYIPQIQWQMLVAGSESWDYVCFDGKDKICVIRVSADKAYQRLMTKMARWFWFHVRNRIEIGGDR